jgi:hypothetical protein
MLTKIKNQLKLASSPFTILGFILVIISTQLIWDFTVWAYEGVLPDEKFYVYTDVFPAKKSFAKGETIRFVTDAEYFRSMDIRWEDTLWCRQDGFLEKYDTQKWPREGFQRHPAGLDTITEDTKELPTWAYTEERIAESATECFMRWKAIGRSMEGWSVDYSGHTDWFQVNT